MYIKVFVNLLINFFLFRARKLVLCQHSIAFVLVNIVISLVLFLVFRLESISPTLNNKQKFTHHLIAIFLISQCGVIVHMLQKWDINRKFIQESGSVLLHGVFEIRSN